MNCLSLETQFQLIGGLVLLLAAYAIWLGQLTLDRLPGNYRNPVLALELVASGDHIDQINRASKQRKGKTVTANAFLSEQVCKDYGFIVIYVLLFSALGLLLARLTSPPLRWTALVGVACAVLAGVLDFVENSGMRKALALTEGGASDDLANMIRYPSLAKWALLFVFSVLIGIVFLLARQPGSLSALAIGLLWLLGGFVGLSGVIANLYKPRSYVMFPGAVVLQSVGLLWMAGVFLFCPAIIISSLTNQ